MSLLRSKRSSLVKSVDDEELSALIEDNDQNETDRSMSIRQRQSSTKNKSYPESFFNSIYNHDNQVELQNLENNRDQTKEAFEYTYYTVQPTDTLQSICLRYACPVNKVKRINGVMSDQDFYGLTKIKLPLGKLGLLQDVIHRDSDSSDKHDRMYPRQGTSSPRPRHINCPGSALSVSIEPQPKFKPLLGPGITSDNISDYPQSSLIQGTSNQSNSELQHNHKFSFSSLKDFSDDNINIDIVAPNNIHKSQYLDQNSAKFIKSDLDHKTDVDDLIMSGQETMGKVFKDLDYHVERIKMSAKNYDKRAAELVDSIGTGPMNGVAETHGTQPSTTTASKIPQIFYCNETFGLNYKRLLALIFIVCILVPLLYINQSSVVKRQL